MSTRCWPARWSSLSADRVDRSRRACGGTAGPRPVAETGRRSSSLERWTGAETLALKAGAPRARVSAAGEGRAEAMNKQELIGHVADRAGLSRNDAMRAVETMLEVITSALKRGDEVRLVGFGNFSVTRRKASTGRNPRTGEPMQIKASSQPKFRPGQGAQGRGSVAGQAAARTISAAPGSHQVRLARFSLIGRARSSVVEHTLHTGGVVGSNPTAPTMRFGCVIEARAEAGIDQTRDSSAESSRRGAFRTSR